MGDIRDFAAILEVKMVMIRNIGIEVRLRPIHHDLTQQTGVGETMQGIVNRGQRDLDAGHPGPFKQGFRRHMLIAMAKQQTRQSQALAGRTQAGRAQVFDIGKVRFHIHPLFTTVDISPIRANCLVFLIIVQGDEITS